MAITRWKIILPTQSTCRLILKGHHAIPNAIAAHCPRQIVSPILIRRYRVSPETLGCLLYPPPLYPDLLLVLTPSISPAVNLHAISSLPRKLVMLILLSSWIRTDRALHKSSCASFSQLVDRSDRINCCVQSSPCIEVLLDDGQQIATLAAVLLFLHLVVDKRVLQRFVRCHSFLRIDGEASLDEFACRERDGSPVL